MGLYPASLLENRLFNLIFAILIKSTILKYNKSPGHPDRVLFATVLNSPKWVKLAVKAVYKT